MQMFRNQFCKARGFTLIELLVVITIIAVLMGLLFPAFKGVQDQAKRTQAKNDLTQIVTAVSAYYTEYGKYPITDAQATANPPADTVFGDPNGTYSSEKLFNILRNINAAPNAANVLNPRQIVFITPPDVKNATVPKSGIGTAAGNAGKYYDPWGSEYVVFIDAAYDNDIDLFGFYSDFTTKPRVGVGAASLGKDAKWGTNGDKVYKGSDDVISWQ
jgi:prepilin-type N-terminal cleavage/methylation domain-containing protein